MRQIIFKYGIIGGILITLPLFIIIPNINSIGFEIAIPILLVSMIISFISVFLGISSVRKNIGGGYIGFRSALATGITITVIMSVIYVLASMILFHWISPGFIDKYNSFMLSQMKAMHRPQAEIDKFTADVAKQGTDQNIFVSAALIFIKPMMFGFFFTFSSALILRKKEFTASLN